MAMILVFLLKFFNSGIFADSKRSLSSKVCVWFTASFLSFFLDTSWIHWQTSQISCSQFGKSCALIFQEHKRKRCHSSTGLQVGGKWYITCLALALFMKDLKTLCRCANSILMLQKGNQQWLSSWKQWGTMLFIFKLFQVPETLSKLTESAALCLLSTSLSV